MTFRDTAIIVCSVLMVGGASGQDPTDSTRVARVDTLAVDTVRVDTLRADTLRADTLGADSALAPAFRVMPQEAFEVGERLVFDVGYAFFTAGEAVMSIPAIDTIQGRPVFHIVFTVNSTPTFSVFYKVEDLYESFLDKEGMFSWKFIQHIREGGYSRDFSAEFDQTTNIARVEDREYPIPPYVHDVVSAFYFARTLEYTGMRVGQKTIVENFYKDTTYPLAIKFLGHQRVSVDAGKFDCLVVEPLIQEGGLFKSEGRVIIWLTNDKRKVPVKVSTKVIIGSIDAELREYSGIVGGIPARVK
jgi:hypothetical protein